MKKIGTENESALHNALKNLYTNYNGNTEVEAGGFICDGFLDDGTIIEVQLGNFAPLKRKAEELCKTRKLVVVFPVVQKKEIHTFDAEGNLVLRRKSPRKGTEWDLFKSLVYAPALPLQKNFSIDLAFIDIIEWRSRDGKGSWRRGGVSIAGKTLSAWHGSQRLASPEDYRRFVPFPPGETWTAANLAQKAGIRAHLARKTLYTLSQMGLVKSDGKKGNARLWTLV
ncbi:MAG: hypothetical protein LBG72_04365 [Spirochaetaceae bacterium]|jgi:hypothetical protein|nr:hypothetical protein [Spirochaetaceae bacterium]